MVGFQCLATVSIERPPRTSIRRGSVNTFERAGVWHSVRKLQASRFSKPNAGESTRRDLPCAPCGSLSYSKRVCDQGTDGGRVHNDAALVRSTSVKVHVRRLLGSAPLQHVDPVQGPPVCVWRSNTRSTDRFARPSLEAAGVATSDQSPRGWHTTAVEAKGAPGRSALSSVTHLPRRAVVTLGGPRACSQ